MQVTTQTRQRNPLSINRQLLRRGFKVAPGKKPAMTLKFAPEKFKLIGGNKSVDFVNTVFGRSAEPFKKAGRNCRDFRRADKLEDYTDLLAWSLKSELIDEIESKRLAHLAEKAPRTAEIVLKRALNLRESIYRILKSAIESRQPEAADLDALNGELITARSYRRLTGAKNRFVFEWTDRAGALDSMLWQISESAAETLVKSDLSRLRQCGSDACNRLFIDTSRNRSRQWCDMKDCGNRAKVRRFRAKRQENK